MVREMKGAEVLARPLLSGEQAKQVAGGRSLHMLAEVGRARKELKAAMTIDDARYFSNKADAMQAWANTYRDDGVKRDAAALKLEAYRRMGKLSEELRPSGHRTGPGGAGRTNGPLSLLAEHGITRSHAKIMRTIARVDDNKFEAAIKAKMPPSPGAFRNAVTCSNPEWEETKLRLSSLLVATNKYAASPLAKSLNDNQIAAARRIVILLIDWLDLFERALPKPPKSVK